MPPNLNSVSSDMTLGRVLSALADPARLAIVARLDRIDDLNCTAACPVADMAKSTRSHHFRILREAGLIETERCGRNAVNRLRRDAIDARFPGLLDVVITNHSPQAD